MEEHQENLSGKNGFWKGLGAGFNNTLRAPISSLLGEDVASNDYRQEIMEQEDAIKRINIGLNKYLLPQNNSANNQQAVKVEQHNNITINGNVDEDSKKYFTTVADKNAEFIAKQIAEKNRQTNRGNYGNGN